MPISFRSLSAFPIFSKSQVACTDRHRTVTSSSQQSFTISSMGVSRSTRTVRKPLASSNIEMRSRPSVWRLKDATTAVPKAGSLEIVPLLDSISRRNVIRGIFPRSKASTSSFSDSQKSVMTDESGCGNM